MLLILSGTVFIVKIRARLHKSFFKFFNRVIYANRVRLFYFEQASDYNRGEDIRLYNQKEIISRESQSFFKETEKMFNGLAGMNGSEKTTFIKLLCRLYDPNEGEILLNGIDIKKYDYDEALVENAIDKVGLACYLTLCLAMLLSVAFFVQ